MAGMFDNLIRHDPRDGGKRSSRIWRTAGRSSKTAKPTLSSCAKVCQFHDGAELTAEDVKATFDRIAKPPSGISIPRSILFKAVSEINAKDRYTIEFKLSEPRPRAFIMAAIASGWNVIVRKKTLEDNNYNLRKITDYPGTGPFRSVRYVENEVRVVEKNPNYWNKGLPYLDGIEYYNLDSVFAGARFSHIVRPVRLYPHNRPSHRPKGPSHPRSFDYRLQSERDPRRLGQ